MAMRSQVDTSMYQNFGSGSSIGEIMQLVNGITSVAGYAREKRLKDAEIKKQKQEDDDLGYINQVAGKYMQGYSGDTNDLTQRKQGAYNEILASRPELNRYVSPMIEADTKNKIDYDEAALTQQGKMIENNNDQEIFKDNQGKNADAELERSLGRLDKFTTDMVDVSGPDQYSQMTEYYRDGKYINVPDSFDEYLQSPKTAFYRDLVNQKKQKKLADAQSAIEDRDLTMRGGEADILRTGSQTAKDKADTAKTYWDMNQEKDKKENELSTGELKVIERKGVFEKAQSERQGVIELINDLLIPKGEDGHRPAGAVGMNPGVLLQYWRGSKQREFEKKVNQLRQKIVVENRGKLKGQGQVSDNETKMLERASTILGTDLSPEQFVKEINNLMTVINDMNTIDQRSYDEILQKVQPSSVQPSSVQPSSVQPSSVQPSSVNAGSTGSQTNAVNDLELIRKIRAAKNNGR